jgi:hypothetical protein
VVSSAYTPLVATLVLAVAALAVFGLVHAVLAARRRAEADALILRGREDGVAWRRAELTSRRERRSNARLVRALLSELEDGATLGPLPVDRQLVRENQASLEALAARLEDARPVSAAGMVAVEHSLVEVDLGPSLTEAIDRLEVH